MLVDLGDETCKQTEKANDMIIIRSHLTQIVKDAQKSWCTYMHNSLVKESTVLYCRRCLTSTAVVNLQL